MKITRSQLRKIINEIYVASRKGVISGEESDRSPSVRVDDRPFGTAPKRSHIPLELQDLLDMDDPDYAKQAYELSDLTQGYPEGTSKTAIDDERQSMLLSKLAGSPLYRVIDDAPEGFKFSELLDGQHYDGEDYFGMQFLSNAGGLMIDIVTTDTGDLQANGFVQDPTSDVWDFFDAVHIPESFNVPVSEISKKIQRLASEMQHYHPGR